MAAIVTYISLWAVAILAAANNVTWVMVFGMAGMCMLLVRAYRKSNAPDRDGPGRWRY